jgi:hypothetical protein
MSGSGRLSQAIAELETAARRFSCVSMAPLGIPVVPLV